MEPEKKSNGALVGLIVIIVILILGGLYIWKSNKVETESLDATTAQSEAVTEQDATALDALDQEAATADASTGVEVDSIK